MSQYYGHNKHIYKKKVQTNQHDKLYSLHHYMSMTYSLKLSFDDTEETAPSESDDGENSELETAKVKRKKKKRSNEYKVIDNRDNLPFLVKVTTPDPYTNHDEMKKKARENTERAAKNNLKSNNNNNDKALSPKNKQQQVQSTRSNNRLNIKDSITSSIFQRKKDGSLHKILGEFALDKTTNCGDIIELDDGTQYQVQKARCQYKYVGGQQFVMTRKILEVKEVKRLLVEKEVRSLFELNDDDLNSTGSYSVTRGNIIDGQDDGSFLE
jgi:hypothetical protein